MTAISANDFADSGYAVLPGFYDIERDIAPILENIRRIIALLAKKHGIAAAASTSREAMTAGYQALIRHDRKLGGVVYDAVKQIPELVGLVSHLRNTELFRAIRPGSLPGIAAGGFGVRIDNPGEEKFRAPWHQEFPAQLRSLDGVVFWTPLLPVTADMGPVEIAAGSHKEGMIPVFEDTEGGSKSGAYALRLENENERLARYPKVAPLSGPGDLILMDFLVLHQSGVNVSRIPRWSLQFRLFNFADPVGVELGWQGSFAAGRKFADAMPELLAAQKAAQ